MASIRHFTTEQFSDGTTIDGNRLERAVQDLENYINNVPDGDFANRWLQSQVVLKYLPWTAAADTAFASYILPIAGGYNPFPYMPIYNSGNASLMNSYRAKGNRLDYQTPFTSSGLYGTHQVAWTTGLSTGRDPVIIDAVDAILASYTKDYVNPYVYDSAPPTNRIAGNPIDNIHLQITMDSSFNPNIQISNSVLWHKYNFDASSYFVQGSGTGAVTFSSDMSPAIDTGALTGMGNGFSTTLHIKDSNLRIPVPPFSRLRFSLILPDDGLAPWGAKPWQTMIPTMTLTLLERLQSD
tara:strand:+ start:17172 stop:18059 length:888 start_codon:yes stop_codon:yes gene_type:complete